MYNRLVAIQQSLPFLAIDAHLNFLFVSCTSSRSGLRRLFFDKRNNENKWRHTAKICSVLVLSVVNDIVYCFHPNFVFFVSKPNRLPFIQIQSMFEDNIFQEKTIIWLIICICAIYKNSFFLAILAASQIYFECIVHCVGSKYVSWHVETRGFRQSEDLF